MAAASHVAASASPYSGNGENSAQPSGAFEEERFAHVDATEPRRQRQCHDPRGVEELIQGGPVRVIAHVPILASPRSSVE